MDVIYDAAAKFAVLEQTEYRFVVSQRRKLQTLQLNFTDTDFFHMAGLQYLDDIVIARDRRKTLNEIIVKHSITDSVLEKSSFYSTRDTKKDVKSRIEELRFLEEYLDTDNYIRIFNLRNQNQISSVIKADYIIESRFRNCKEVVYIFLRRREEDEEHFCVVSFFKKGEVFYGGDKMYWMEKVKITNGVENVLYRHNSYTKKK